MAEADVPATCSMDGSRSESFEVIPMEKVPVEADVSSPSASTTTRKRLDDSDLDFQQIMNSPILQRAVQQMLAQLALNTPSADQASSEGGCRAKEKVTPPTTGGDETAVLTSHRSTVDSHVQKEAPTPRNRRSTAAQTSAENVFGHSPDLGATPTGDNVDITTNPNVLWLHRLLLDKEQNLNRKDATIRKLSATVQSLKKENSDLRKEQSIAKDRQFALKLQVDSYQSYVQEEKIRCKKLTKEAEIRSVKNEQKAKEKEEQCRELKKKLEHLRRYCSTVGMNMQAVGGDMFLSSYNQRSAVAYDLSDNDLEEDSPSCALPALTWKE